jgi:hypothetical protein
MGKGIVKLGEGQWAVKDGNLLAAKETNGRFKNTEFTVSRGTRASYVGRDGLIKESNLQDVNLVTNGTFDTDSDWSTTSTWDIVNNQAEAIGNGISQYIQQDFSITNGNVYKFSYEIIENTLNGNGASLSSSGGFGSVSLSNVVGTHTEYITASNDAATYALKIGVSGTATTGTIKIDNISVKEVKTDTPRIDFTDNTDGHLLLEPQRTNYVEYSNDASQWTDVVNNGTVTKTANYAVSPDGSQNATRLEASVSGSGFALILLATTTSFAGDYVSTVYVKSNTGSNQDIVFYGRNTDVEVHTVTGEWTRIQFKGSSSSGLTNYAYVGISTGKSEEDNPIDILVWGGQLEQGTHPTSYIPTNGSTVTRDAETCTGAGSSADFNSEEGVLYAEIAALENDDTNRRISISDGSDTNRLNLFYTQTTNEIKANYRVSNSTIVTIDTTDFNITNFNKIAFRWQSGNFVLFINGENKGTNSNTTMISSNTLNVLRFEDPNLVNEFYGKCKAIKVYKEALSDTDLQNLTS